MRLAEISIFRLQPNNALLVGEARRSLADGVEVYRGDISGNDGSWVRLVVANGVPRGVIWDGQELFAGRGAGGQLAEHHRAGDLQHVERHRCARVC